MAQSNRENPEATPTAEADAEAWKVAADARKYRIHDDKVWVGANGILCSVPAPAGFASLAAPIQPFAAQALLQMVQNRIVQTGEGNVQELVNKALTDGSTVPGANTNDAFERHYLNSVTDAVEAKIGKLPSGASAEDKATRETTIRATAIKHRGGTGISETGKFIEFRDAGIAAAMNKPVTEKKRQPKAAANLDAAVEL